VLTVSNEDGAEGECMNAFTEEGHEI
jgi:hypothetical protein